MSSKVCATLLFVILVAGLLATPAMAMPTLFTDRATFDRFVGSYTLLTLDHPDNFSFVSHYPVDYGAGDGVCIPGVCSYGGHLLIADVPDYNCGCGIYGNIQTTNGTEIYTVQPVTAFGYDVFTGYPIDSPSFMDINVSGTTTLPAFFSLQADGLSFFGITDSSPFMIGLSSHWFPFIIDNVAMKLAVVPEPSSLLLLGLGLLGLAAWRWKHAA